MFLFVCCRQNGLGRWIRVSSGNYCDGFLGGRGDQTRPDLAAHHSGAAFQKGARNQTRQTTAAGQSEAECLSTRNRRQLANGATLRFIAGRYKITVDNLHHWLSKHVLIETKTI